MRREAHMTGAELSRARLVLGERWGLGRPLHMVELAKVLRLGGRDPGANVREYEAGRTGISGPMSVAVELLLAGGEPPDGRPGSGVDQ
jgi:hypothetical protein